MFNNTAVDIYQHNGDGYLPGCGPEDIKELFVGPVQFKTTFINSLSYPITVVDRTGIRHVVPPVKNYRFGPSFIIRLHITFDSSSWDTFDTFLSGLPENKYHLVQKIKAEWEVRKQQGVSTHLHNRVCRVIIIDHVIEPKDFFDRTSVYHRGRDLIISKLDILSAPPHPFHPDAARMSRIPYDQHDSDPTANACVQFEMIEGDKPLVPRYLAISNKVFIVHPKKDIRRPPGVYVTTLERDPLDPSRPRAIQKTYSLEEMESELNLYRTPEEALAAGDIKTVRKEELEKLEHTNHVLKKALESTKIGNDQTIREMEHQHRVTQLELQNKLSQSDAVLKTLTEQHEREKLILRENAERQQHLLNERAIFLKDQLDARAVVRKDTYDDRSHHRKDYYEERSSERKDSSEVVKFLPAILIGIGGLITLAVKVFGGK